MNLKPWARTALWTGCGALGGIAVGGLWRNFDAALSLAAPWALLTAAYVGLVLAFGRNRAADAPAPPSAAPPPRTHHVETAPPAPKRAAPVARGELRPLLELPDVPRGFPPVMGDDEEIRVRLKLVLPEGPAEGAAVRLHAQPRDAPRQLAGEGLTGADGSVEFVLAKQPRGELALEAQVELDGRTGTTGASVSIVRYEDEIERLFGEFRAYAVTVLGPEAQADTARELADRLRVGATSETAQALLELARIYELVAYGERDADRRLYLALMKELLHLEQADLPETASAAAATGA